MPCLRGIEVSLVTGSSDECIPEFPHPEGSSARLISSHGGSTKQESISTRKAGPTIATYIPSVPGHCFAIKYHLNVVPPSPCKHIVFKLFLNGRAITTWGIDPTEKQHGTVVKSLWAPGPSYNGQAGLECRNFVFLPGQETRSPAEDGGLIEVKVFRARDRKAQAPRLEEFHPQKNYGIASPSIGLVDLPQEARYYVWHLIDPKDLPFATFRFHYRSWESLEQLNLIPPREFEFVRSLSTNVLSRSTTMEFAEGMLRHVDDSQATLFTKNNHGDDSQEALFTKEDHGDEESISLVTTDDYEDKESIFEESKTHGKRGDQPNYSLGSPPIVFPLSSLSGNIPQPSKALRDAYRDSYLQRPLPELPREEPSVVPRRSSESSVASICPSLTPSLKKLVDDGAFDDDAAFEIGVARTVTLSNPNSFGTPVKKNTRSETLEDISMSDYATSPASTSEYYPSKALSPGRYLPTTGSSFDLGLEGFTLTPQKEDAAPVSQTESDRKVSTKYSMPPCHKSEQDLSRVTRLRLSESEWMSRTPSPLEGEQANTARRLWSPPPSTSARTGRFLGFRKKSSESPEEEEVRSRVVGNWI
ncbi:hypothetical protein B0T09DRAFT_259902 [Sordaria sp. MPI-SDFR-AT-0083]|nr:hypothetical protein B0T09DRAFT_259902 [Sordaria sp. MPI-SDFR-AT-0083]